MPQFGRGAGMAVFLDRDGTLVSEVPGYLRDPEELVLLSGVADALCTIRSLGFKLFIVTNQSSVARGILSTMQIENINARLEKMLLENGVLLDGLAYCPHHPEGVIEQFRVKCDCRKPKPGMLIALATRNSINLAKSWMVGDNITDVAAGRAAGCRSTLVLTGHGMKFRNDIVEDMSSKVCCDLNEFAQFLSREVEL